MRKSRRIKTKKLKEKKAKSKFSKLASFLISAKSISYGGFILTASTFLFLLITYNSPASIHSELLLVQRSDSLYQGQIYIWNSGDETANDIIIRAKYDNVFVSDSKNKRKLRQYLWPHFTVESYLTPKKILNHLGEKTFYPDYKIIIKNLPSKSKYENYFIVTPEFINKKYWNRNEYSKYQAKFYNLEKVKGVPSYVNEILSNVKIIWNGEYIIPSFGGILTYSRIDSNYFESYFPGVKQLPNRNNTNAPELFLPPFIIKKKRSGGYSGYGGY